MSNERALKPRRVKRARVCVFVAVSRHLPLLPLPQQQMNDPKAQKTRLPKSYTDEQLAFLRGHLAEFERRAGGVV